MNTLVTYNPISVTSRASIIEACRLMQEYDMRHLPIVDDDYRVIGIVSDFDAAQALREDGGGDDSADSLCVSSIMTRAVVSVGVDAPQGEALALMLSRRFHSIPILDDGRLSGIVTTTDYLREFATLAPAAAREPVSAAACAWRPVVEATCSPHFARCELQTAGAAFAGVAEAGKPWGVVSARRLQAALSCDFVGDPSWSDDGSMIVAEVAQIGDLLPAEPGLISPRRTLGEAAALIAESRRDGLAVVDGDVPQGMITDGDLLRLLCLALT